MQMSRLDFASASLLLLVGCAGFPFFHKPTTETQEPPPQAVIELQNVSYDRQELSGRLLIGTQQGSLKLDKRLVENVSVSVESVEDCATGKPVGFLLGDRLPEPARESDLLILTPGYWYGADVQFLLFGALNHPQGPECINVSLSLQAFCGGKVARKCGQRTLRGNLPRQGTVQTTARVKSPRKPPTIFAPCQMSRRPLTNKSQQRERCSIDQQCARPLPSSPLPPRSPPP